MGARTAARSAGTARPRTRLACAAAAVLLLAGAAACTDSGETTLPSSGTDTAASDGGLEAPAEPTGTDASDGDDGIEEGTQVSSPRLLLVADPGGEQLEDTALAALLGGQLEADAECDGPLDLAGGDPQTCGAPASAESEGTVVWIAQGVLVPDGSGGSSPAVLFTLDLELSDEAALAIGEGHVLSALPMGSMYGAEPISADQLGTDALATLTSENALTPVAGSFADVGCSEGLDFSTFEPVTCVAARADGSEVEVQVLPGIFAGYDQGLIVSVPES